MRIRSFLFSSLALALAVVACGKDNVGPTDPPPDDPKEEPKDPPKKNPPAFVWYEAKPDTVTAGRPGYVRWKTNDAESCSKFGVWFGSAAVEDSVGVIPTNVGLNIYGLTCANGVGDIATASDTIIGITPVVSATLAAEPDSGDAPLKGVDLIAQKTGTAQGATTYSFKCNATNAKFDAAFTVNANEQRFLDGCSYSEPGTYTALVEVDQEGAKDSATVTIKVTKPTPLEGRAVRDRPDDFDGPQWKMVYIPAADGKDRKLDSLKVLDSAYIAWRGWMRETTDGIIDPPMDTFQGEYDVMVYRSQRTENDLRRFGSQLGEVLAKEIFDAGLADRNKRYIFFYDGENDGVCSWPFIGQGIDGVALFLRATTLLGQGGTPCTDMPLPTKTTELLDQWGSRVIHQMLHTSQLADTNAVNHCFYGHEGHTKDHPEDLMYAPCNTIPKSLFARYFDFENDDFFKPDGDIIGKDGKTKVKNVRDDPYFRKQSASGSSAPQQSLSAPQKNFPRPMDVKHP